MQTCGKYIAGLVLIANSIFAREYGLPVGSSMPDFVLQDQNGEAHRLRGLLGPKGAMILFVRSAEWCPYCKSQLVELEQNKKDFRKLGVNVLAVSYDNVTKLHSFAEHRGIRFPLLSDSGSGLIRAVGVLNDAIPRTDPYFGSSYPCVFVLNEKGVILAKYFEEDPAPDPRLYKPADPSLRSSSSVAANRSRRQATQAHSDNQPLSRHSGSAGLSNARYRPKAEHARIRTRRRWLHPNRVEDQAIGRHLGA